MRHARSTLLIGSIDAVKTTDRWPRYLAALPARHHDILLQAVAGTWIPLEASLAHYATCDTLDFTQDEQVQNGRVTFDRSGATVFGTIIKMAKGAGVTPWTLISSFQRFWDRGYDGGGIAVYKLGPKEARIETVNIGLLESRYYKNALRGVVMGAMEKFCTKAYVTELPGKRGPHAALFRVQWA
jgi:hypothetical protein